MSDSEEDYDDDEEEEDFDEEEEEEEEEEGGEGEDSAAKKVENVKEDIAMLMDVFGYMDRTSKRIASRLEVESNAKANKNQAYHRAAQSHAQYTDHGEIADADRDNHNDHNEGEEIGANLTAGWSQYEHMSDPDRGLLLEKAILGTCVRV